MLNEIIPKYPLSMLEISINDQYVNENEALAIVLAAHKVETPQIV